MRTIEATRKERPLSNFKKIGVVAIFGFFLMGLSGCATSGTSSSSQPEYDNGELSSQLGKKAGEFIIFEDPFYDPDTILDYKDELCLKNYEIDKSKVSNRSDYLLACDDVIMTEVGEQLFGDTWLEEEINPETGSETSKPQTPETGSETSKPQTPEAEITYWKPTVQNMINCSKAKGDSCATSATKDNTFGKDSLQIAQQLIDKGICSKLVTEGLSTPNSKEIAVCVMVHEGEIAGEATIETGDKFIIGTLRAPLNGYSGFKAVLKDGLLIFVSFSDIEDLLLSRLAGALGGKVESIG